MFLQRFLILNEIMSSFTILSTMMILGPSCLWMAKMWMSLKVKTMKSKARTVRPASYVLVAILEKTKDSY